MTLPSSPSEQPGQPDRKAAMRASDADREQVAEKLREAAGDGRLDLDELQERLDRVFAAKTYGDLAPLTEDLPEDSGYAPGGAVDREQAPPLVIKGGAAGDERKGAWLVPRRLQVHGGMSGVKLNFTQAVLHDPVVDIQVHGDMGGVTIVVPETWRVELLHSESGMGGVKNKATQMPPTQGRAPLLRAVCSGGMGGVTIRYPNRLELWWQRVSDDMG